MRPKDRFPWGRIVEEWEIGPYHIAAYHPTKTESVSRVSTTALRSCVDETVLNYHIWVDGRDTHTSSSTLEGALIIAIAEKSIGRHPDVSMVIRALKLRED